MRISLFLLVFSLITACSTVESVEQNSASNLGVDNADTANFDVVEWEGQPNYIPTSGDRYENGVLVRNYYDGTDWRTQASSGLLNSDVTKYTTSGKHSFHYGTFNGEDYSFNFQFDPNSKTVS